MSNIPEVKRKLASIRQISELKPIEGADIIELAIVDGWHCAVKIGQFKPGDLCIYFEIDSFLPIRPEFEFLRKSSYRKMGDLEGFHLRTMEFRGQLSQGLAIPLSEAYEGLQLYDDVTELLGVVKYEPPIPVCLNGVIKGYLPSFIRKTDQERVQNIWDDIKHSKEKFEVTVKLDGTSCTYYLNDGVFGVCGKNLDFEEDENNILWKIARDLQIEEILRHYGKNIALQGEVIGEKIQGNHEKLKGQQFYLFDIWDIQQQQYWASIERRNFAANCNLPGYKLDIDHIPHVPVITAIVLEKFKTIDDIIEFADGVSLNAEIREGIVLKSYSSGLRFKVISNEYLLKEAKKPRITQDDLVQIIISIYDIYCTLRKLDKDNVSHCDLINIQENLIRSLHSHYDILRESYDEYQAINNVDIGFQTEIENLLKLMKVDLDPYNGEISNVSRIT